MSTDLSDDDFSPVRFTTSHQAFAMYQIGDMVYFWTGRGSHGYAIIREVRWPHFLLNPEPDAKRGSDFRTRRGGDWWAPRDRGVLLDQIDTPPNFWYTNF